MVFPARPPARARRYWFPAKTRGWGWGPPCRWQGWVVVAVYALAMAACAIGLLPHRGPMSFLAASVALSALMVAVCWITGEPPRWRWGAR